MRARWPDSTRVSILNESVVITGELTGDDDLVIEGQVDGSINMPRSEVTIREHGRVNADIVARVVVVSGAVQGNIRAVKRIELLKNCSVVGDVSAPRVTVAPLGVRLRGALEVRRWRGVARSKVAVAGGAAPTTDKPLEKELSKQTDVRTPAPFMRRLLTRAGWR